jgi:hypothetical protein
VTEIDAVERNLELICQGTKSLAGLSRIIGGEAHVEPHHPVAPPLEKQGRHGTVHAAAQGNGYGFIGLRAEISDVDHGRVRKGGCCQIVFSRYGDLAKRRRG